jgi:hypothetical protein
MYSRLASQVHRGLRQVVVRTVRVRFVVVGVVDGVPGDGRNLVGTGDANRRHAQSQQPGVLALHTKVMPAGQCSWTQCAVDAQAAVEEGDDDESGARLSLAAATAAKAPRSRRTTGDPISSGCWRRVERRRASNASAVRLSCSRACTHPT